MTAVKLDWNTFDEGLVDENDYLDLQTGAFVSGVSYELRSNVPAAVLAEPARFAKVPVVPELVEWVTDPGPRRMAWAAGRMRMQRSWRCFARTVADPDLGRQMIAALEDPGPDAAKRFQTLAKSDAVEAARFASNRTWRARDSFWGWVTRLSIEVDEPSWLAELAAWRVETESIWTAYVEELLVRLDAALQHHAPRVLASLRPGATDAQLAEAEAELGFTLPAQLARLYRWHEGSELRRDGRYKPQPMCGGYWIAPLASMVKHHALCKRFALDGTFAKTGRGGVGWWDAGWIPFLQDQGGGTCCVDMTGTFTQRPGQLIVEYHGDTSRPVEYLDVDAWIETLVRAIEAGVIGWNAEYATVMPAHDFGPDLERWHEFHARHNPGLPMRFTAQK